MLPRRSPSLRADLHTLAPDDRAFRRSLTDEVAIDFPSASVAAECLRRSVAEPDAPGVIAEIVLDSAQAARGATVPVWLDLRHTWVDRDGGGKGVMVEVALTNRVEETFQQFGQIRWVIGGV